MQKVLHYDALGAAASVALTAVHVHLLWWPIHARAASATGGVTLHLTVVSSDLADNVIKSLLDIESRLGGGLNELAAEIAC